VLCVALAACGDGDAPPAPVPAPALTLPAQGSTMVADQRSTTFVRGSDGRLRVRLGDITRGQVQLTLLADGTPLIAPTSVREGDTLPFVLEEKRYVLTVVELTNRILSGDFATLRITAGRSERMSRPHLHRAQDGTHPAAPVPHLARIAR
jgi:hypothetical protein